MWFRGFVLALPLAVLLWLVLIWAVLTASQHLAAGTLLPRLHLTTDRADALGVTMAPRGVSSPDCGAARVASGSAALSGVTR